MPKFKNREEYEKWKAESMRDVEAERKTPEDQDGQMIALDKCPDVVAEDSPPPLNITVSNTQQGHTMQQTASPPRDGLICANCGHLGRTKSYTRGSLGVELLLWIFFLVPGLIYSVWRQSTRAKVCRACGSPNVIPTSTPRGEQLWQELHSYRENWLRGEEKAPDTFSSLIRKSNGGGLEKKYKIIGWVFGVLFALPALFMVTKSIVAAFLVSGAAALLLPPVRERVFAKTKITIPAVARVIAVFVLMVIAGNLIEKSEKATLVKEPNVPAKSTSSALAQYTVVSTEDVSYANVIRKSYRVRVPRQLTKNELTTISDKIVHEAMSRQKINAIVIFFFLPDSDTNGVFTAGKATWAPDGDWSKAATSLSPRLVVETGGVMGTISNEDTVDLPVAKKKEIFMDIVRYQDQGMDSDKSYTAAAKQFSITLEEARKISLEGAVKGWQMP